MAKDLVNDLYKFLKEDVNESNLFEADSNIKKPDSTVIAIEGRVPTDPSSDNPENKGELKEKEGKEAKGEIPPAEETEENKETKVEDDLEKATPELEDNKALEDQEKGTVEADEGRVPADPSSDNAENKGDLKEDAPREKELTTMSDEMAAKELASKYTGGRVIPDAQGNQFIVMVPESAELVEEVDESKASDKAAEEETATKITKAASSLLRKIHKATALDALNDVIDNIEKSATSGKINAEQETRLNAAAARRKEAIKDNPEIPAEEPTAAEEDAIEECVVEKQSGQQQAVPKTSVTPDISLPGTGTDKKADADVNAKSQAGTPGKKSVDQQATKTDVKADANVDDVKTHSVPDNDLNPDAKKKVGSPKGAKTQSQQVPKTAASAKISTGPDQKAVKENEEVAEGDGDQQQDVPKTTVDQGAKIDDVKPCSCGETCTCEKVEEEVSVSVQTEDGAVDVSTDGATTTVTTSTNGDEAPVLDELPAEEIPAEEIPSGDPVADIELEDDDVIMSDESVLEMAEKLLLTGHLKNKKGLSDKEKAFVVATESVKLSEKNKELVEKKLKELQG